MDILLEHWAFCRAADQVFLARAPVQEHGPIRGVSSGDYRTCPLPSLFFFYVRLCKFSFRNSLDMLGQPTFLAASQEQQKASLSYQQIQLMWKIKFKLIFLHASLDASSHLFKRGRLSVHLPWNQKQLIPAKPLLCLKHSFFGLVLS